MSEAAPEVKTTVTVGEPHDWTKILLLVAAACLLITSIPVIVLSSRSAGIISAIGLTKAIVAILLACLIIYGVLMKSGQALKIAYYSALVLLAVHVIVLVLRIIAFIVGGSGNNSDSNNSNNGVGIGTVILAAIILIFHIFIPLAIKSYMARDYPSIHLLAPWAFFSACKGDK